MAVEGDATPAVSGPGLVAMLVAMVVLTLVAAGGGFGVAWLVHAKVAAAKQAVANDANAAKPPEAKLIVKELPTILTKLSGSQAPWLRLNLSIVVAKGTPELDRFAETIAQDVLAFVSNLPVDQVTGPTNFDILRADLQEILRIRSKGAAHELFIRGMLME
ncbi:MAG: hypothetical protein C0511_03935 [Hyphomicrobium sp.]|nr:hypothetical protein [Hyphomicrobium sp.]